MLRIEIREPVEGDSFSTIMMQGLIPRSKNYFSSISYIKGDNDAERAKWIAGILVHFADTLSGLGRKTGSITLPAPELGEVVETGNFDLVRDGDPPFKG